MSILAEDGWLKVIEEKHEWEVLRCLDLPTVDAEPADLLARFASTQAQIKLTQRCGEHLADILNGSADPLQFLFPDGSLSDAESLYQNSPEAKTYNTLAQNIASMVVQTPQDRPLRILEVGAGTGSTTAALLPSLPAGQVEYLFTDISSLFLNRAKSKFKEYPFVRYQLLNIEQDPSTQGLEDHQFDLVIAVNVLHATADLRKSLKHIQQLLTPNGMLLATEAVAPERWIDLTFGLTDGWWRFTDLDLRPSYPLLSQPAWLHLLREINFVEAVVVPETSELSSERIFIARAPQAHEPGSWLIFTDQSGVGNQLAAQLQAQGVKCFMVHPAGDYESISANSWRLNPANPGHFQRLWQEVESAAGESIQGIAHLWSLDIPLASEDGPESLQPGQVIGIGSLLYLLQGMARGSKVEQKNTRLWLITRGAQSVTPSDALAVSQSPIWGMAKVITLEHPEWNCSCVDLDGSQTIEAQAADLHKEIWNTGDAEDQIAYRNRLRHVARLVRVRSQAGDAAPARQTAATRLIASGNGVLDEMVLRSVERQSPQDNEVEIEVRATGLNFRDVMNALAMRSDTEPLGSECSGRITAVGAGVIDFHVGEDVVAIANGSFSMFVTVDARLVVHKPSQISFVEAATIPMAFMTADFALNEVAQLIAGQCVLIHAASGGVGLAAVQLALRQGAEVFGTAGNPEKRAFLESIGVQHVLNSRTLDFAEQIMHLTNGKGVDLVLNSLSGEFIPTSLSVLTEHGTFLEIGKRDIWTKEEAKALKPNARYHIVDLSKFLHEDPAQLQRLFRKVMAAIAEGSIRPLRYQTFPLQEAAQAFRFMAQAKHIGKIVLTQNSMETGLLIKEDATYLITGGLRGLGLLVAQHLTQHGARHLVLMGRSEATEEAKSAIADMEEQGAQVRIIHGDVSNGNDLRRVLNQIEVDMPGLRGVIHSAGVLEDGVLLQQDWKRFSHVMAPKVDGAWNLHSLTQAYALDFFVMFSSTAAIFGSAGQANHAAANTFMDILAHYRQAQGQPALSINWGIWSEVGIAAEKNVAERMIRQGIGRIDPQPGLTILDTLLQQDIAQMIVSPIHWPVFLKHYANGRSPAWLSNMTKETQHVMPDARAATRLERSSAPVLQQLLEAPANQKHSLLLAFVNEQTARVLGLDLTTVIDPRQPLQELGLDSLTAVELRNMLSNGLKIERSLPATLVFDYPTISALTDYLARDILKIEAKVESKAAETNKVDLLENIENLSDEEVAHMLSNL